MSDLRGGDAVRVRCLTCPGWGVPIIWGPWHTTGPSRTAQTPANARLSFGDLTCSGCAGLKRTDRVAHRRTPPPTLARTLDGLPICPAHPNQVARRSSLPAEYVGLGVPGGQPTHPAHPNHLKQNPGWP